MLEYGVPFDLTQALHYAQLAAKTNPEAAQFTLAKVYLSSQQWPLAVQHLQAAVAQEPPSAEACLLYAQLQEQGVPGLKASVAKAQKLYKKAAEAGSVDAMVTLGSMLEKKDLDQAAVYFKQAAEMEHPEACYRYGSYLRTKGQALPMESVARPALFDEAIYHLTKASLHQIPLALIELALMHFQGTCPPEENKDYARELLFFAQSMIDDPQMYAQLVSDIWGDLKPQFINPSSTETIESNDSSPSSTLTPQSSST